MYTLPQHPLWNRHIQGIGHLWKRTALNMMTKSCIYCNIHVTYLGNSEVLVIWCVHGTPLDIFINWRWSWQSRCLEGWTRRRCTREVNKKHEGQYTNEPSPALIQFPFTNEMKRVTLWTKKCINLWRKSWWWYNSMYFYVLYWKPFYVTFRSTATRIILRLRYLCAFWGICEVINTRKCPVSHCWRILKK